VSEPSLNQTLLQFLLDGFRIPTKTWKETPGARTITDLLIELLAKESELRIIGGELFRVTKIVKMYILDGSNSHREHLIGEFEVKEGKTQKRNRHPSGKFKAGESPEQAFEREMKHELGLEPEQWSTHLGTTVTSEFCDSKSYPGLQTMYEIHHIGATLKAGTPPTLQDKFVFTEPDGTELHFRWPPFISED